MNAFSLLLLLPLTDAAADSTLLLQTTSSAADEGEQRRSQLQWDWQAAPAWQLQWHHDYRILAFPASPAEPANNGHLHQLSLALTFEQSPWQLTLQPVIATSSNALRDRALHSDDLRWQGEWALRFSADTEATWRFALRLDDQLGRYRWYPGFSWQPALQNGVQLQLGWPRTELYWSFADTWQWRGFVMPAGAQWHVYDKTRAHDSELYFRQWQFGGELHWQLHEQGQLRLGLQRNLSQQLRYALENGDKHRLTLPDQTAWTLSLQWQF